MNTKLFLKGVLLYITFIVCFLAIGGIDSLYDNGYFFETILVVVGLIYLCKKTISEEEFEILSLDKFFNKHNL